MSEQRPAWDRALDVFRSEQAAFRVLLAVACVCGTLILLVLLARSL